MRKPGLREVVVCPSSYWFAQKMEFEPRDDNSLASGFSVHHKASLNMWRTVLLTITITITTTTTTPASPTLSIQYED